MRILLLLQASYFFITGIWPLVHIKSFMKATGFKHDIWLVKMVGLLTMAISISFVVDAYLKADSAAIIYLAILSAIAYFSIDFYYSAIGKISKIYLIDAAIQLLLIITWLILIFI
jgi:hypothetical protein